MVEQGEIGLTRAYECSKLYKVQQLAFAQKGWANMPKLTAAEQNEAQNWLLTVGCKDFLQGLNYLDTTEWSYIHNALPGHMTYEMFWQQWEDQVVEMPGGWQAKISRDGYQFRVEKVDIADPAQVLSEYLFDFYSMFSAAKKLYKDKEAEKQRKSIAQEAVNREKLVKEARDRRKAITWAMLNDIDNWELVGTIKSTSDIPPDTMKIEIRRHVLWGGGWLLAMIDPVSLCSYWDPKKNILKYSRISWLFIGPDGQRQNMADWDRPGPYAWDSTISIDRFLIGLLEKVEAGNGND